MSISKMDPASLALGAVILIKPICKSIIETSANYHHYGQDSERIKRRFSVQVLRINSFQNILFKKFQLNSSTVRRIIDRLPSEVCENIAWLLWDLYSFSQKYAATMERHTLDAKIETELVNALRDISRPPEENCKAIMDLAQGKIVAKQNSTGWLRKATWAVKDKRSLEELVEVFEQYTERLKTLLELAWWPLPFFQSMGGIGLMEVDNDAKEVGLLEGIGMRKLILDPSSALPGKSGKNMEISRVRFKLRDRIGPFEIGNLDEDSDTWYITEYKSYDSDSEVMVRERVTQLTALMDEAINVDSRFKICKCKGFFRDAGEQRIGIVSLLPLHPNSHPQQLHTLSDFIGAPKKYRPDLGNRIKLAVALMKSLQLFHLYGWVHKSLRSENVLLFPSETEAQVDNPSLILHDPKIIGFDHARPDSDFSDINTYPELSENLYRHPARWGKPSERFAKVHDIYGTSPLIRGFSYSYLWDFY